VIFVPHGPLHFLPFHALRNGEEYLCDAYTVSYAPSANVFALCQEKTDVTVAIPSFWNSDQRAPLILSEVQSVAPSFRRPSYSLALRLLPSFARTRLGNRRPAHSDARPVPQDNPMFSGIKLGDGYLNLYDLYQMRLGAKLVTLSGCATE